MRSQGIAIPWSFIKANIETPTKQSETDGNNEDMPVARLDDSSTGPAAMLRNCLWMQGSHRTVFCDRFYTSVKLFLKLKSLGINAVGTILANRKGFSPLAKFSDHEINTEGRGALKMLKHNIKDSNDFMLCLGWLDTKPVYMLATGVSSAAEKVLRRTKRGELQGITACRPTWGVDTHDYMRMGAYSLQKSYHILYWPKTIFLAHFDLVLVNIYILWKLVNNNSVKMRSREEFYRKLAEEMYFYRGFSEVGSRTRYKRPCPSPGCPTPTKAPGTPSSTLSKVVPGHQPATYLPMPKKTRNGKKLVALETHKYGTSGRNKLYRHCFVCQRIAKRVQTSQYCATCRVPVCPQNKIRTDHFGNDFICWKVLHSDKKIGLAAARKQD
jgi:hypothetical protein